MRVEQEQKVTEDARMFAEQDAAAQRYAAQMLQVSRSFSIIVVAPCLLHCFCATKLKTYDQYIILVFILLVEISSRL